MVSDQIAIFGDAHFGVRGDSKIFHAMMVSFYTKAIEDVVSRGIKNVILLGDIFERRKYINFETLYVMKREIMDVFLEHEINVYTIAGNHDVYFKNTNRINSLDLLLTNEEYPNVYHVIHDAEELEICGTKFLFVPWVNRQNYDDIRRKIEITDATMVIAHLDMAGFEMHRGAISDRGHFEVELFDRFDKVLTGHYHTRSSKGNIYYLGTAYQTSWNDYGEDKGWHILNSDGSLEYIVNNDEMFHRFIFDENEDMKTLATQIKETNLKNRYVRLYVRTKRSPKLVESVIAAIEAKRPFDLNVIDESLSLRSSDDNDYEMTDTLEIIRTFVMNDLETDLDKSRLFTSVSKLYQQALEMDDGE